MTDLLAQDLTLPCGAVLPNRLCKAAMTEGLSDPWLRATPRHETLYRRWSEGGSGLLITGNVMIDRRVLERPGNVAIDRNDGLAALRRWAKAGTANGNHLWMQLSHAGRQSPRYVTGEPMGPSAVQLEMLGNYAMPRALREDEILDFIGRFAAAAATAREAGFTGVQIHAAHGYLLSAFLSPVTNRRDDAWGGSVQNRARFLVEAIRATRKAVGADFPIGVKLNSDDFRKGGFSNDDCLQVVGMLNDEGVDLLEVSGGTYEQPRLLGIEGRAESAQLPQRESTRKREAYFLEYADRIRGVARMPLMVTGGFRSRAGMEAALEAGSCDVIGLARPLCTEPDLPKRLLAGSVDQAPHHDEALRGNGRWRSVNSPLFLIKIVYTLGQMGWFYQQIFRLADGRAPDIRLGIFRAFLGYLWDEQTTAWRMRRARRRLDAGVMPSE